MPLHGKNIIGRSLSAEGPRSVRAVNPATGEALDPPFVDATPAEVARALELADLAFRDRRRDPAQDAALLEGIAAGIEALGDELIARAVAETGLTAARIHAERARTTGQLRLFARLAGEGSWIDARIDRPQPDRKPAPKPDLRRMLLPIGPVVVFPASNFPLAFSTAGGDTASAFAAGNPVIVKARPSHAGTAELVGQAVQRAAAAAGLPDGWFSMLHGAGRQTGVQLVQHPAVKAVGFTGSIAGGRALCDLAAARPEPIPVYAEMGSINPVFLLPDALAGRAEKIAEGFFQSLTLGAGQFCTNPGLVAAIDGPGLDRFLAALGRLVEDSPPGTMLFRAILEGYEEGVGRLSQTDGVQCVARSRHAPDAAATQCAAAVFATTAAAFLQRDELAAEVFGPATLVVRCRNDEEMRAAAERLHGQLTATVHATEPELARAADLLRVLERKAGRLIFNGFPTGVEVCAAMHHGGPYPASSDVHFTSVGTAAIYRFARPVCYQDCPQERLPPELRDRNQRGIWRLVDDELTRADA